MVARASPPRSRRHRRSSRFKHTITIMSTIPRGIRNNNPLNIRISTNKWCGKLTTSSDPQFEQFRNITFGIRAAFVCIRTYINRYKLVTPSAIISRWAPRSENDTQAYIKTACKQAVLNPSEIISFKDKNRICRLLWGMAYVETGRVLSFGLFENAYELSK